MPNDPPSNLVVNFLVFQAPDIFTKLSGISVALISKGTCIYILILRYFKTNANKIHLKYLLIDLGRKYCFFAVSISPYLSL